MQLEAKSLFKDPTRLTRWTLWLLYLQIVISVIAVVFGFLEYQILVQIKAGGFGEDSPIIAAAGASDTRQMILGGLQFFTFVVSGILSLMWIHRANYNARQLGATGMEFTPGWAVGWYFIPLMSLFKPYQSMKEIWHASVNPQDWHNQKNPRILIGWWAFWIISNGFGNASFRISMKGDTLPILLAANVVTVISDLTWIPLCFIFIAMVRTIHRRQMAIYRELNFTDPTS